MGENAKLKERFGQPKPPTHELIPFYFLILSQLCWGLLKKKNYGGIGDYDKNEKICSVSKYQPLLGLYQKK